jgi:ubiquinone/menaquinone biosynthesis C-methylase UbiE
MEREEAFFDFAAYAGLTKHFGGLEGTDELVELCHIGAGSYVLDVGCGAGQSSCYLASRHDCRVVGVDIRPMMVQRSQEMARRERMEDRVEFRVADAQDLPFDDNLFDAVITESVTVFPEDKQRAVNEYTRVTKPGGYVGLSESTWLKVPPPPELVEWASQDVGATIVPMTAEEWTGLLASAGLRDLVARIYPVNPQEEAKGALARYGLGGMLRIMSRMLILYTRNPNYRRFLKDLRQTGVIPENLDEYFGYGVFVGRK